MSEIDQLGELESQNKPWNKLRRVFGVVWGITALIFQRLKIWDLYGPDMAMTSSTTSGKKSLFFRDTREHPEHDAKNRLSLPSPSPEKPLAEIHELKKTDLKENFEIFENFISLNSMI